jgi:hypothetical protein
VWHHDAAVPDPSRFAFGPCSAKSEEAQYHKDDHDQSDNVYDPVHFVPAISRFGNCQSKTNQYTIAEITN